MPSPIDPRNVQGLVFQLYRYAVSRHLLFKVTDAAKGRAFLRGLLPQVTHAGIDLSQRPEPLLNIGVTWTGLSALGVIGSVGTLDSAKSEFPSEFRNPPPLWVAGDWGNRVPSADIHLTVHLYCRSDASLALATQA